MRQRQHVAMVNVDIMTSTHDGSLRECLLLMIVRCLSCRCRACAHHVVLCCLTLFLCDDLIQHMHLSLYLIHQCTYLWITVCLWRGSEECTHA